MISVIIPSFNQQEYLPEAIESVLGQIKRGWDELIVVDDGSTDNSLAIAKRYLEPLTELNPKIRVISQVNKGLASARNTGIMNAEKDWILPLDADDILLEVTIEKIKQAIRDNPDADIIAPSFKCFGKHQDEVILMDNPTLEDFKVSNRIGYFSAIRKSKLLEVGGHSPRMTWGYEDLHLWFNLLARGAKIKTLKDVLVLYRTKEKSMIHEAQVHHEELMAQIKKDFPLEQVK